MGDFHLRRETIERLIQETRAHAEKGRSLLVSLADRGHNLDAPAATFDIERAKRWGDKANQTAMQLGGAFQSEFLDRCGGLVPERCRLQGEEQCSGYHFDEIPVLQFDGDIPGYSTILVRPNHGQLVGELSCAIDALDRVARLAETRLADGDLELFDGVPARQQDQPGSGAAGSSVFVVHGHDDGAREGVARFLEKAGLKAVILHEKPNSGATIIEKLERYSDVAFAIILLTGDDACEGVGEGEMQRRARQNVIFEAGLFVGRLGRDRVALLYEPGVEIPSDLHGLLYTELDAKDAWKIDLLKELIDAGLPASEAALLD